MRSIKEELSFRKKKIRDELPEHYKKAGYSKYVHVSGVAVADGRKMTPELDRQETGQAHSSTHKERVESGNECHASFLCCTNSHHLPAVFIYFFAK